MIDESAAGLIRPAPWVYRLAGILSLAMLLGAALVWPGRDARHGVNGGFLAAYGTTVSICDLLSSGLLLANFLIGHRRSGLVLHLAYAWIGSILLLYTLCFPGAFAPEGLLGASHASSLWLWTAGHFGFASLVLLYATLAALEGDRAAPITFAGQRRTIVAAAGGLAAAVGVVGYVCIARSSWLPQVIAGLDYRRYTSSGIGPSVLAVQLAALASMLATTRIRTVPHLWLSVSLLAGTLDVATAISSSVRGTTSWYASRAFTFAESTILLVVLVSQVYAIYARAISIQRGQATPAPAAP